MATYGFSITNKGRALISKLMTGARFEISRVMVGSGTPEQVEKQAWEMTDLAQPVAAATSTVPVSDGESVSMVIEYRSDLNGGLEKGFWLNEFGVYAYDPDDGEVLIYYGCLGDYPQWVSAASPTGVDVRRYPVVITIGTDAEISTEYSCEAWMTAEDVAAFCNGVILSEFIEKAKKLIAAHDADKEAHFTIQGALNDLQAQVSLIELQLNTKVEGNPFKITFDSIDGLNFEGILNEKAKRAEF